MSRAPCRGILTLIWIAVLALGVRYHPASAQEGSQVYFAPINLQDFPSISSYFEVYSPSGEFVHGVEKQDVRIIEDGRQLSARELQHLHTGVQFVLGMSPGPAFDIRDVQGVSRYEYLSQALQDWALSRQGSTIDDLSIITPDGPEMTHQADLARWAAALQSFNPTIDETGPDFDVLTRALDIAADQPPTPGMSGVVLFITPLPRQDSALGLQSLAARAAQQGIKIFIWLVASAELFSSPEAEQLRVLAEQTGGDLFAYSGQESIPSPENFLEDMREVYFLTYDSRINSSGVHQASIEVVGEGQRSSSAVQEFELDVLPPNIAFISPPTEIERKVSDPESESPSLAPNVQVLEVLIEFPDGHARPIIETRFYVDGIEAAVNREQPFNRFTWDISEYDASGEHILVGEVKDSLGIINRTVETSVLVNVSGTEGNLLNVLPENRFIMIIVMVAASIAAVLLIFVLGGRLQPGFLRNWRRRKKLKQPVTQPLPVNPQGSAQSGSTWINRIRWPRSPITTKPDAQFIPITDASTETSIPPLAITKDKVRFGKDEDQVDQVLNDNSIEGLHASLERVSLDKYRLSDEGTTAGTWVNYEHVPAAGQTLEHGDLVHFGRLGFRFILRNPGKVRKPVLRYTNTE